MRLARRGALLLLLGGCEDGTNERDIAQLRAELDELRVEVGKLRERVQAEPASATAPPPPASADRGWRRVDLPGASIEFPAAPTRRVLTLEAWRKETGVASDSSEAYAAIGTTGSVLEYRYVAPDSIELVMTEIISRGGVRASLDEHLERLRAKLLRADPVSIQGEKEGKLGRFRTLRLELALADGGRARVVLAAGAGRKGQSALSPDVVLYLLRAEWAEGETPPRLIERFLGSLEVE